jgi:hypothetical protein
MDNVGIRAKEESILLEASFEPLAERRGFVGEERRLLQHRSESEEFRCLQQDTSRSVPQ